MEQDFDVSQNIKTFTTLDGDMLGAGTLEDPYQISNKEQLKNIENNMSGNYVLTSDINLEGERFLPIGYGTSETAYSKFLGTLDGQGYKISNLEINLNASVGLFAELSFATIKNLVLENFNTEAKSYAGTLAGQARESKIENVISKNVNVYCKDFQVGGGLLGYSNKVDVNNSHVDGVVRAQGDFIGGLVGNARDSNFYKSSFVGEVSSTSNGYYGDGLCVGGLIGSGKNVVIEECFVEANISCVNGYVGGIIGQISGTLDISNSFVIGDLSGAVSIGGLVATSKSSMPTNINITNSYFVGGILSGNSLNDGGLVLNYISTKSNIINSYFDSDKSNIKTPTEQARTILQLKQKANYANWSLDVWDIEDESLPSLKWFNDSGEEPDTDDIEILLNNIKDNYISITEENLDLSGNVISKNDILEITYTISSGKNSNKKIYTLGNNENWFIDDLNLDIGSNYLKIEVYDINSNYKTIDILIDRISKKVKFGKNVFTPDEKEIDAILSKMFDYFYLDNNTEIIEDDYYAFIVSRDNPMIINKDDTFNIGNIIVIPPNKNIVAGMILKILEIIDISELITKLNGNNLSELINYDESLYKIILMQTPKLNEIFNDDLKMDYSAIIDEETPIAYAFYSDGTMMNINNEFTNMEKNNSIYDNDNSSPGFQLDGIKKLFKPTIRTEVTREGIGEENKKFNIVLEISDEGEDIILFDDDGDLETKDDQGKIKASINLSDIELKGGIEWHPKLDENYLPQQIYSKISMNILQELNINWSVKEFDMKDIIIEHNKNSINGFENSIKVFEVPGFEKAIKAKGVDIDQKIFLGVIGFNLGSFTGVYGEMNYQQLVSKLVGLPPHLTIYLFLDLEGKVSGVVSFESKFEGYSELGFNMQKKDFVSRYGTWEENQGQKSVDLGNDRTCELYNLFSHTSENKEDLPQSDLSIVATAEAIVAGALGVGVGFWSVGLLLGTAELSRKFISEINGKARISIDITGFNKIIVDGRKNNLTFKEIIKKLIDAIDIDVSGKASMKDLTTYSINLRLLITSLGVAFEHKYFYENVNLEKEKEGAWIGVTGIIQDDEDKSLKGVIVELSKKSNPTEVLATKKSDDNGKYIVHFLDYHKNKEDYILVFKKSGLITKTIEVTIDNINLTQNIKMDKNINQQSLVNLNVNRDDVVARLFYAERYRPSLIYPNSIKVNRNETMTFELNERDNSYILTVLAPNYNPILYKFDMKYQNNIDINAELEKTIDNKDSIIIGQIYNGASHISIFKNNKYLGKFDVDINGNFFYVGESETDNGYTFIAHLDNKVYKTSIWENEKQEDLEKILIEKGEVKAIQLWIEN